MKLPEYDNRPAPGAPLFHDPTASEADWTVLKAALGFVAMFAGLGALVYGIVSALRGFF